MNWKSDYFDIVPFNPSLPQLPNLIFLFTIRFEYKRFQLGERMGVRGEGERICMH
jgi:hypothetical protein